MQLTIPADLQALIEKRISTGAYETAGDVLRRALEAQDAEEDWTDEERQAISSHIEDGFRQAERANCLMKTRSRLTWPNSRSGGVMSVC
jgi:Arc/MetJ-type ribon-helix-helix transcriptional regulator